MPINEKDQQQLIELFSRTTKGGPDATTATRLFNEKASALGLDSFKLYNSFVQGGSLTVYEPPQPPAVPQAKAAPTPAKIQARGTAQPPKTQTRTILQAASREADTLKFRLYCSKHENWREERGSAVAVFRQRGGLYYFERFEDLIKGPTEDSTNRIAPGFPIDLLVWGRVGCPHCGTKFLKYHTKYMKSPPAPDPVIVCKGCHKPRCTAALHKQAETFFGQRLFHCNCGTLLREDDVGPTLPLNYATDAILQEFWGRKK